MAKAIKEGKEVKNIKIEVNYKGDSQRPTEFQVEYEINNRQYENVFQIFRRRKWNLKRN